MATRSDHNAVRLTSAFIKVNGTEIEQKYYDELQDVIVESSMLLPAMAIATFTDHETKLMDDTGLFPLGAPFIVETSEHDNRDSRTEIFRGEIVGIEPIFDKGTLPKLAIRAYDKGHRLHRGTKTRTFLNKKDSDIAQQIASDYGLTPQIDSTQQVFDHIYQDGLNDMDFLQQRAARIGYEVFIDQEKLYFRAAKRGGAVVSMAYGDDLLYFRPRLSIVDQVDEVVVRGWNVDEKKAIVGKASRTSTQPSIGQSGSGGTNATSAIGSANVIEVHEIVHSQADADNVAQALLDDLNTAYIEAEGEAYGEPKLKAGSVIELTQLGNRFSGEYMLTTVRHVLSPDRFTTYFTIEGHRPRTLVQLLSNSRSNGNRWHGVVPAIVTNIEDPDQMGRVKVKYPWLDDQQESHWARVSTMGGGGERGFFILPEVNDEVLVSFEQGDINRPFVLGNLYNGKDKPPTQAVTAGKVKERIIQTRTGHKIRMVDQEGSDNFIEIIDAQGHTSIRFDAQEKKITIQSNGEIAMKSKGDISIQSDKSVSISGRSGVKTESQQKVSINGQTGVTVESSASLDLKGLTAKLNGTTSAEISSTGNTTVRGTLVKIN